VAAYGRLPALDRAVRSALRQTVTDIEIVVVCDAVSEDFLSALDWEDERVRILNLNQRAGAQYGPNSIGLLHARAPFVAFLNHDDLWLDDHLERALQTMLTERSTFHFATAAFVQPQEFPLSGLGGRPRLSYDHTNGPFDRWRCAHPVFNVFEPASAWVVDADLARRVGSWSPPRPGRAVSVVDWIARAVRCGARFSVGVDPTVVKVNLHHAHEGVTYGPESQQHVLLERLLLLSAGAVRAEMREDLDPSRPLSPRAAKRARRLAIATFRSRVLFMLYLLTGWERALSARSWRKLRPRFRSRNTRAAALAMSSPRVLKRTGETFVRRPEVSELSATAFQGKNAQEQS
jgi:glycosyltransferase involved in cell wall biosynthesis